jgi:putative transposase
LKCGPIVSEPIRRSQRNANACLVDRALRSSILNQLPETQECCLSAHVLEVRRQSRFCLATCSEITFHLARFLCVAWVDRLLRRRCETNRRRRIIDSEIVILAGKLAVMKIYRGFPGRLYHRVPHWVEPGALFHIRIALDREKEQRALSDPLLGQALLESAEFYQQKQRWQITLFLLMPDHLHALLSFPRNQSMSEVTSDWKRFHTAKNRVVWQEGYFDHRLRNDERGEQLSAKMNYIRQNPVAAGLCATGGLAMDHRSLQVEKSGGRAAFVLATCPASGCVEPTARREVTFHPRVRWHAELHLRFSAPFRRDTQLRSRRQERKGPLPLPTGPDQGVPVEDRQFRFRQSALAVARNDLGEAPGNFPQMSSFGPANPKRKSERHAHNRLDSAASSPAV